MKLVVFDSGPLINFSINGFLPLLEKLKSRSQCKFIITHQVKHEIYDRPLKIEQFELGALRIHSLIESHVLEMPESIGISSAFIDKQTQQLMIRANHSLKAESEYVPLVSDAEVSCLVLAQELNKRKIRNIVAIDERTARMLVEKPASLAKIISDHVHKKVTVEDPLKDLQDIQVVRSSELIYAAHKLGLTDLHDEKALEALLYATKFKGTSISWDEINQLKRL
jgi:hypothetical protein